jgi:hypothetical protein
MSRGYREIARTHLRPENRENTASSQEHMMNRLGSNPSTSAVQAHTRIDAAPTTAAIDAEAQVVSAATTTNAQPTNVAAAAHVVGTEPKTFTPADPATRNSPLSVRTQGNQGVEATEAQLLATVKRTGVEDPTDKPVDISAASTGVPLNLTALPIQKPGFTCASALISPALRAGQAASQLTAAGFVERSESFFVHRDGSWVAVGPDEFVLRGFGQGRLPPLEGRIARKKALVRRILEESSSRHAQRV